MREVRLTPGTKITMHYFRDGIPDAHLVVIWHDGWTHTVKLYKEETKATYVRPDSDVAYMLEKGYWEITEGQPAMSMDGAIYADIVNRVADKFKANPIAVEKKCGDAILRQYEQGKSVEEVVEYITARVRRR